jgi:hypothetical protein
LDAALSPPLLMAVTFHRYCVPIARTDPGSVNEVPVIERFEKMVSLGPNGERLIRRP